DRRPVAGRRQRRRRPRAGQRPRGAGSPERDPRREPRRDPRARPPPDPGARSRPAILEHAADLMEARMPMFIALCTKEAGKTIPDGVAEVREAVDFLRYYGQHARQLFVPDVLPGPTGESNTPPLS